LIEQLVQFAQLFAYEKAAVKFLVGAGQNVEKNAPKGWLVYANLESQRVD
jgi:hypothetical protein